MASKVVMPRLSLTMKTGTVIQWLKEEGQAVEKGEPVVEVLSEKVTYNVEAPGSGIIRKIMVEEGLEVEVNTPLCFITSPDEKLPDTLDSTKTPSIEKAEIETRIEKPRSVRERIPASPAAKKMAREHGIDLSELKGTGPHGRIVEEDVRQFLNETDLLRLRPRAERQIPLVGIRRTTAERVTSSFRTAPHSFIMMDVDVSKMDELRRENRVSYTAIIVYAAAKALRIHQNVNSAIIDDKIHIYQDINVGVAVSTDKGLTVPVLKNADKKKLLSVSTELKTLIDKTREGHLSRQDLIGGTFTVTNLGMYDVKMFLPIINPPEAAILAAGSIEEKPAIMNGQIVTRPTMTLTLAYDHRIIDGAPAARFLRKIKETIETELPKRASA
jgi:pyruvate dehydrogenase E2 component (dihydrolipoamide acetyltransferase)